MQDQYRVVVVMGVCGVGKTTVAVRLADALAGRFMEGDDFHAPESIAAMRAGTPLDDAQRAGWLDRLSDAAASLLSAGDAPVVIACSALRRAYRDHLRRRLGRVLFVHLDGEHDLIRARIDARRDHFMPASMLESQIDTLEPPDRTTEPDAGRIDISASIDGVVDAAIQFCRDRKVGTGKAGSEAISAAAGASS